MNTDVDMLRLKAMGRDVTTIAQLLGWAMPKTTTAATTLAITARQHADSITTAPQGDPTKPTAVAAWVEAEAARQVAQEKQRQVAGSLAERLEREALRMTLETAPLLLNVLIEHFAVAVDTFREVAPAAPTEVNSYTTADEFSRYTAMLRATDALTAAAAHRARLAEVLLEDDDSLRAPLWLVMMPTANASLGEVDTLTVELEGQVPTTREHWMRLCRIGASMAQPGEVPVRLSRHAEAHWHSGMQPDGGMQDKTYSQAMTPNPAGIDVFGQMQGEPQ